ncbi:MAG: hypothetical protein AAFR59_12365 [Bacteroidota bacterium]
MVRNIICTTLIALTGMFQFALAQGTLSLTFDQTDIHHCSGADITLTPIIAGGTEPYQVQWSTDGNGGNWFVAAALTFTPTVSPTIVQAVVSDDMGSTDTATVTIHVHPECVWPGDANGDGLANNLDILEIGRAFKISGFVRPGAHLNWAGQAAPAWPLSFSSGVNYAHADANGNGIIDTTDIMGILHNYNIPQTQGNSTSGGQGAPLFVDIPANPVLPGDTVTASIILGTQALPADSIYGLTFSVKYSGYQIDSGSVQINYNDSWIGSSGTNVITIDKAFYGDQQVDIGIVRNDNLPITGYGRVADIIVIVDEIIGKQAGIETIDFFIDHVSLIGPSGNVLPVNTPTTQLSIFTSGAVTSIEEEVKWEVRQSEEAISVLPLNNGQAYSVQIMDLQRSRFISSYKFLFI